jgi:hypothetical protein
MERLARLFVGIGFIWVAIVIVWALAAGVDQPYAWYKWAADSSGYAWMQPVYLALALFIVPIGMLTFLRDIFGDPGALWAKCAMPGVFLVIYAFFLLIALPDGGVSFFRGLESVVNPGGKLPTPGAPGSTTDWLIRVGMTIAVWAGIPGVIGAFVGAMTSSKPRPRRED